MPRLRAIPTRSVSEGIANPFLADASGWYERISLLLCSYAQLDEWRFSMASTKRLIVIGLACLTLVLLAPVLLFLAAAIYLMDGLPVLVPEDWIDRRGRSISLLA